MNRIEKNYVFKVRIIILNFEKWFCCQKYIISVLNSSASVHLCRGIDWNGNPLQYSCLENPTGGGAWWATVHGVAKSQTRLSDFTSLYGLPWWFSGKESNCQCRSREDPLEKEMATHSSILALRIPWLDEPGGLQFMRSQRVRYEWAANTHTHVFY